MYDDNPKRVQRLSELTSDTQSVVGDAKALYAAFLKASGELNSKLAAVYAQAKLQPPDPDSHDILAGTEIGKQVANTDKEVRIADIVIDMVGATAITNLAPAATAYLVDAGLLTEAEAGTALLSMLEVDITVGGALGGIIGIVVAGAVGAAVTGALSVFTGQSQANALDGGIAAMKDARLKATICRDKLRCICDVVEASKTACDTLIGMDLLTNAAIEGLIKKQAAPALKALSGINRKSAIAELLTIDLGRGSWMGSH